MPRHLLQRDHRKETLNQLQKQDCHTKLASQGMNDEELQTILTLYIDSMKEEVMELEMLQARIMSDDHFMVNAAFEQKLDDARETYQGIFEKNFKKTVEEAKKIDSFAGSISFVVSFLDTAVESIIKARKVHDEFSMFLEEREDKVRDDKLTEVQTHRATAHTIKERIKSDWLDTKHSIDSLTINEAQKQKAVSVINHEKEMAFKLVDKLSKSLNRLRDHIQTIDIDLISLVRGSLPHKLMADFLLHASEEGPRSSKVFSLWTGAYPWKQFKTFFFHSLREGHIKAHYLKDIANKVDVQAGRQVLSTNPKIKNYQLKCLSAVLKRFPLADYQAERFDYYVMKGLLKRVVVLIKKSLNDIDTDEMLELTSSLMMCEVDLKAHYQLPFRSDVPFSNHFLSHSQFGPNKHLAIKSVLDSHFTFMSEAREKAEKVPPVPGAERDMLKEAETIHNMIKKIIEYYGDNLVNAFWDSPLIKRLIENKSGMQQREEQFKAELTRQIEEEVIKLINNELIDATPSPYFCAPLCGLSQFLTGLGGEGKLTVGLNKDKHFEVIYSGDAFKPLEDYNPPAPEQTLSGRREQRTRAHNAPSHLREASIHTLPSPYPPGNQFQDRQKQPPLQPVSVTLQQQRPVKQPHQPHLPGGKPSTHRQQSRVNHPGVRPQQPPVKQQRQPHPPAGEAPTQRRQNRLQPAHITTRKPSVSQDRLYAPFNQTHHHAGTAPQNTPHFFKVTETRSHQSPPRPQQQRHYPVRGTETNTYPIQQSPVYGQPPRPHHKRKVRTQDQSTCLPPDWEYSC